MSDENFISEFKRVYKEKGKRDLKSQIPYLSRLAHRYKRKGRKNPREQWSDLLKAHSLFNSCAGRSEGEDKERWEKAAYEIQIIYWGKDVETSQDNVKRITDSIKQKLASLRDDIRMKLGPVNDIIDAWDSSFESLQKSPEEPEIPFEMCKAMKSISEGCNSAMVEISRTVIEKAIDLCGRPPCDFSAVAFGSLAKGEATPYSDLEFLFLIDQKTDDSMVFFETLALTTYFIIGILQETKLKYMNIKELQEDKWFDDEAMSGFKIDGLSEKAGNIPTGNGLSGRQNKFILTPVELGEEYRELLHNPSPDQTQPGDMTDMLTYTLEFYNHNHNNLLETFQQIKSETKSNTAREQATMDMLKQDIEQYNFKPHSYNMPDNPFLDLKSEIYRYPSILIYDLKLLCKIEATTTWETLSKLRSSDLISQSLYNCLLFLICSAQYIRYSAYLHYDSQRDEITVLRGSMHKAFRVSSDQLEPWRLPHNLLFLVCRYVIPVKLHISHSLSNNCNLQATLPFFKYAAAEGFYSAVNEWNDVIKCIRERGTEIGIMTSYVLAKACRKVGDYGSHILLLTEVACAARLTSDQEETKALIRLCGGTMAFDFEYISSLLCMQNVEKVTEALEKMDLSPSDPVDSISFHYLLSRYYDLIGHGHQAEIAFNRGITLRDEGQLSSHANLMFSKFQHYNQAVRFISSGELGKAEKLLYKSLKLNENLYGENSYHEHSAKIYYFLGVIAAEKCDYTRAIFYQTRVVSMPTSERGRLLAELEIARCEMAINEYRLATARLWRILLDIHRLHSTNSFTMTTQDIACVFIELGECYLLCGKYESAIINLQRSAKRLAQTIHNVDGTVKNTYTESQFLLAKAHFLNAVYPKSLLYLRSMFVHLSQGPVSFLSPPSFLDEAVKLLKSTIRAMAQLSDDDRVNIRQCYLKCFHLYSRHKTEKLALECLDQMGKY